MVGVITFRAYSAQCLLTRAIYLFSLSTSLSAGFYLAGSDLLFFSDGHSKIKADLARGLAATKGSVQVFSLEVRKIPSQLLDS